MNQQPSDSSVNKWARDLSNPDRFRRSTAAQQLVDAGLPAATAWPLLVALQDDPYRAVRLEVVRATYRFGVSDEESVPLLRKFLQDEDPLVCRYAQWALENRSPGAVVRSEQWLLEEELGWWGPSWNTSRDDPWWRDWLTSRELFTAIHRTAPRVGRPIQHLLGGTVFECGRNTNCWVQVWVAGNEIVVAYPSMAEVYGAGDEQEGPHELAGCVHHLRHSEPLELGRVRGRSSYGAACASSTGPPEVKWAQCGDWAGLARGWHFSG
jgi:hypothetical protein